jgi:hypothetical protein
MSGSPTGVVLTYIRCPCCGRWCYLGKFEAFNIYYTLEKGFDIPFEVDYRVSGGRARGWRSRVRVRRLPNMMKRAYDSFVGQIREANK